MDPTPLTRNNTRNYTRRNNGKTPVDYIVVSGSSREAFKEFNKKVKDKIHEGYIPQGGVIVTYVGDAYQSMVKY